jgi:hypothetical protein
MKKLADNLVARLAEGLMVTLLLLIAAVWDALIAPKWNGIPVPIFLFSVLLLLFIFAPHRWQS